MNKTLLAGLVIALVAAGVAAYMLVGMPQQKSGAKLLVITRLAPEEGRALRDRFLNSSIAKSAGILEVEFKKEDVGKWRSYVEAGAADIFLVGGFSVFATLCGQGLFEPITSNEILARAQALGSTIYRDSEGRACFLSISRTVFSFTINREYISRYSLPRPSSWEDLASPEFSQALLKGDPPISFPQPSKSTTAARTITLILEKYGWERGWQILTIIGANSKIVESSERARDDVAAGVSGAAPTVLIYGLQAVNASSGRAEFVIAEKGLLPDVSPVAIAKNTRNKAAAEAFILWLLSDEGQRALAELFYYLPYKIPGGTPLESIYSKAQENVYPYDPLEASKWDLASTYYFEGAIADPDANTLLKKAWSRALEAYASGKISRQDLEAIASKLGSPLEIEYRGSRSLFTRDYAASINSLLASAGEASAFKAAVKKAALERYSQILSRLGG